MKKYLSDVFETDDNKLGVEWEYEDGGRTRDFYETEDDRENAINENEKENELERKSLIEKEEIKDDYTEVSFTEQPTVTQFFKTIALKDRENLLIRYKKLINIKAPEVILQSAERNLYIPEDEYVKEYISFIKNFSEDDVNKVVRYENKTGRGGKKYLQYELSNGQVFNFFPKARFGMIIFPHTK